MATKHIAEERGLTEKLIAWRSRPDDEFAAGDLWKVCWERMRFLASKLLETSPQVRRREATDDLVQNALLRLFEALKVARIESDRHLFNLVAKKMREEFIDKLRHYSGPRAWVRHLETNSQRAADGERINLVEQAAANPMTSATESDRWQRFHAAVDGLPEQERQVFEMRWYLGARKQTIVETLGCSDSTVKRLLKSAKQAVKAATDYPGPA